MTAHIEVVGAVIVRGSRILAARRGPSTRMAGMWEFPGGKVEPGESPRRALSREIDEELGCRILVGDEIVTTSHEDEVGRVTLTTFYCELVDGEPVCTEHAELRWLEPDDLPALDWAPADVPAVASVRARLGSASQEL